MPYGAGDVLVRPVMTSSTGLPADAVTNDFAFRMSGAPTESDLEAVVAAVDGFYRDTQTAGNAVGEFISNAINRAVTHRIEVYKIQAGPLGSPIYETDWLGPPTSLTSTGVPTEVAAVLSFHGDLSGVLEESGSTRPRARRRGRVYIGPLNSAGPTGSTPPYLLGAGIQSVMRQAAVSMYDEADAAGWTWSVWSRANAELYPVVAGWTDDAPDTQRRRGPKATTRTVFTTV